MGMTLEIPRLVRFPLSEDFLSAVAVSLGPRVVHGGSRTLLEGFRLNVPASPLCLSSGPFVGGNRSSSWVVGLAGSLSMLWPIRGGGRGPLKGGGLVGLSCQSGPGGSLRFFVIGSLS
jgi:hypothetical protein